LQAAEHMDAGYAFDNFVALEDDRKINVCSAPHEWTRHDSDHSANRAVQVQLGAERPGIASELPLPEAVAEHARGRRVRTKIVGRERSSQKGRDAHGGKRIARNVIAAQPLRLTLARPENIADG